MKVQVIPLIPLFDRVTHDHGCSPVAWASDPLLRSPLKHKHLPALAWGEERSIYGFHDSVPIATEVAVVEGPALEVNKDMACILSTIILSEEGPPLTQVQLEKAGKLRREVEAYCCSTPILFILVVREVKVQAMLWCDLQLIAMAVF